MTVTGTPKIPGRLTGGEKTVQTNIVAVGIGNPTDSHLDRRRRTRGATGAGKVATETETETVKATDLLPDTTTMRTIVTAAAAVAPTADHAVEFEVDLGVERVVEVIVAAEVGVPVGAVVDATHGHCGTTGRRAGRS